MIPRYPHSPEYVKAVAEAHERRRKEREERKAQQAAQGPQQRAGQWRYPYGIGTHAIALCVLAVLALVLYGGSAAVLSFLDWLGLLPQK